jgi:hypothetical protein
MVARILNLITTGCVQCPRYVGPGTHSMTRSRVADIRGDGLQIWKVATNVPNNSRGQLKMGGPSALWLGEMLTTPRRKKKVCYEMLHKVSELDRLLERPRKRKCEDNIRMVLREI